MGLYDLHKNNTENTAFDTKTKTAPECNKKNSKDHQSEATALISCLNNDFICIVELFKAHGCDVTSDPNEIKIAYDTSWFSEYRVIKGDGVYLYREVSMGGYKLEKRLDCRDISTSFLILCADILLGMKYKKMICDSDTDYKNILQIMTNYKHLTDTSISSTDKTNFLVQRYNDLILDIVPDLTII